MDDVEQGEVYERTDDGDEFIVKYADSTVVVLAHLDRNVHRIPHRWTFEDKVESMAFKYVRDEENLPQYDTSEYQMTAEEEDDVRSIDPDAEGCKVVVDEDREDPTCGFNPGESNFCGRHDHLEGKYDELEEEDDSDDDSEEVKSKEEYDEEERGIVRCHSCDEEIDELIEEEDVGHPICPKCGENPLPPVGASKGQADNEPDETDEESDQKGWMSNLQ